MSPCHRFRYQVSSLFYLWWDDRRSHDNPCIWCIVQVLARHVALCRYCESCKWTLSTHHLTTTLIECQSILLDVGRWVLRPDFCCAALIWLLSVNRWLSVRFNLLSSAVIGVIALVCVLSPSVSASLAGFALAFAATFTNDVCTHFPSITDGNWLTFRSYSW